MSRATTKKTQTITYFRSGKIKRDYYGENYDALYLGTKVLSHELMTFSGKFVYAMFAFSDNPIPPERFVEMSIEAADGNVSADYHDRWSELTGYLWTDEESKVGGHDLQAIFRYNYGKYGALLISTEPIDLQEIFDDGEIEEFHEYTIGERGMRYD